MKAKQDIITEADLREAILMLEERQAAQGKILKEEFHDTYQRLKPANFIKNIISDTVTSPEIRGSILHKTVDVAVVFLTNMILRKVTNSSVKRTIGTALVLGIKNVVSRNPEMVRNAGTKLIKFLGNMITRRNRNREYKSTHI